MMSQQFDWQPRVPAMRALVTALLQETPVVYAAGGVVRDALLGIDKKVTDLDLVVAEAALPLARRVADRQGWAYYPLDEARDVARLVFTANQGEPYVCDIARIRGEDIGEDLRTRDFTVNAMAFELRSGAPTRLIDVSGGQEDLAAKRLRRVTAAAFADDPARLLRAVRLAVQFGFELDAQTDEQIRRMATTVKLVSPERQRDEIWKMLVGPRPEQAIALLHNLGLLALVLPEVAKLDGVAQSFPHYTDVFTHTLRVMAHADAIRAWLRAERVDDPPRTMWQATLLPWRDELRRHFMQPTVGGRRRVDWLIGYALFHDVGKSVTRTVESDSEGGVRYRFFTHDQIGAEMTAARLDALRFSRYEITLAAAVVRAHMRPHLLDADFTHAPISRRAIYRFFQDAGEARFDATPGVDTLLLAMADYQAIHEAAVPARWDEYLEHISQMLEYAFAPDGLRKTEQEPLLDGHALIAELGMEPGPGIGALLRYVAEAQAAGEVSTRTEALSLAEARLALVAEANGN
ncbi:MAG: HD domain-containing protein [Caldilineaceae bacterium]|nr:HD domain-containing protein [Caldilineaceae bacterium]